MEQVSGIEPPSQPWQGRVLADVLHLHNLEGLVGFEPTIRELQSHALPLGYGAKKMERATRFELATSTLARWRSTG